MSRHIHIPPPSSNGVIPCLSPCIPRRTPLPLQSSIHFHLINEGKSLPPHKAGHHTAAVTPSGPLTHSPRNEKRRRRRSRGRRSKPKLDTHTHTFSVGMFPPGTNPGPPFRVSHPRAKPYARPPTLGTGPSETETKMIRNTWGLVSSAFVSPPAGHLPCLITYLSIYCEGSKDR